MATPAHSTLTPKPRRRPPATFSPDLENNFRSNLNGTFLAIGKDASDFAPLLATHARIEALPAGKVFRPSGLQFALAYLRNGDAPPMCGLPPIALDDLAIFTFSIAACLALGVLLGSAIA